MSRDWQKTGESVVNASADLISGFSKGIKGIGNRFKRSKHAELVEALCAISGDVVSQNGRFRPEEERAFRDFILQNREHPAFTAFETDELVEKMKNYAIACFLCDKEKIVSAIQGIEQNSDSAKFIILATFSLAFGDGYCDASEARCIREYATLLGVDLTPLSNELNITLPELPMPTVSQQPIPTEPGKTASTSATDQGSSQVELDDSNICYMCKNQPGKVENCLFCKGTGKKKN